MNRKYSMPEYYKLQGMLAKKHNITDFHAGCHIAHYPDGELCMMCVRAEKCKAIFEQEKESDIYKER